MAAEGLAGLHDLANRCGGPGENVRRASWQCHQDVQGEFFMKERAWCPILLLIGIPACSGQVGPTPPLIHNEQTASG